MATTTKNNRRGPGALLRVDRNPLNNAFGTENDMSRQSNWKNVTTSEPCEICGAPDWCSISTDRAIAHCKRIEEGSFKPGKTIGYLHRLTGNPLPIHPRQKRITERRLSDNELHAKWAPRARAMWKGTGEAVKRLARHLGVAAWALDALEVGYGELHGVMCWSFPERNARGQIVGINRRLVTPIDGNNKRHAFGSRPALSFCDDCFDYPGPVHIVEGGSDTAAGLTLGLCVIGRPSNLGGIRYLVPLLGKAGVGRRIVVFAERDRKRHDDLKPIVQKRHNPKCRGCMLCWPGMAGAKQTAATLAKRLGRKVEWRFLPDKAKDLRAWLNMQNIDVDNQIAAFAAGRLLTPQKGETI